MADTLTPFYSLTEPTPGGDSNTWGGLLNTDLAMLDTIIGLPRIVAYTPVIAGSTVTIDLTKGNVVTYTVVGATTLAFANVPSGAFASSVTLLLTNGGAGALTWPASVAWLTGAAPKLRASGVDILRFVTVDNGTTWYGELISDRYRQLGTSSSTAKVSQTLHTASGVTTTSTSDASVDSYSLPANALATNGDTLRITVMGVATNQNCTVHVKFGATDLLNAAVALGTQFAAIILLTRNSASLQTAKILLVNNATASVALGTPSETLTGAVTIDFRGSVTSGGTFEYHNILVEAVSP